MIRRWVGMAVLDAKSPFRRIRGDPEVPILREVPGRLPRSGLDAKADAA